MQRTALTPAERKQADSLYAVTYKHIKARSDSLCDAIRDSLMIELVDSISEVRLTEVQKLIDDK